MTYKLIAYQLSASRQNPSPDFTTAWLLRPQQALLNGVKPSHSSANEVG
jgi:hypothetical protein